MVEPSGPPSARIRCEILPVACADGHVVALRRQPTTTSSMQGWWHELPPGRHPTRAVVDALSRELDGVFDKSTSIVHSTSWRYEGEHLVLSYLVVLHPPTPLAAAPPGFVLEAVDGMRDSAGGNTDTSAIPVIDVLTHGLRHLAMLRVSDAAVAEALPGCWHELLASRHPLPAGLLEHYVHTHDGAMRRPTASAI